MKWRKTTIGVNILALLISIPLLMSLGSEFMPPLDEQSILFMPVTLPDVSNEEAKRILQVQDKIIKSVPEVDKVLGKAGRASTATDNSAMSMIETIIMLKPKSEWREGITKKDIINELDAKMQIPGVVNGWTQPIINRINMLATGIRTDVGVKVYVMVIYLNDAMQQLVKLRGNSSETISREELKEYVIAGAAKRLRPKIMTVCVSLFGLIPVLWSTGVGSDVMQPSYYR